MKKPIPARWQIILILFGTLFLTLTPLGVRLEESVGLRLLFWLRGPVAPPKDVIIVAIDEDSSYRLGLPEPEELSSWPRSYHAHVIKRLKELGAKVIAIDIAFQGSTEVIEDQQLANAIEFADNVVLLKLLEKFSVDNEQGQYSVEHVTQPLILFRDKARAVASFTLQEHSVKKYAELFKRTPQGIEPTMPLVALQVFSGKVFDSVSMQIRSASKKQFPPMSGSNETPLSAGKEFLDPIEQLRQLREIVVGNPAIGTEIIQRADKGADPDVAALTAALIDGLTVPNPVYLNFYGPRHTITTLPYHFFFEEDRLDASVINGKAVFIGLSEARTKQRDYFYTIFSGAPDRRFSGVEIAATLFANLVEGNHLHRLVGWQIVAIFLAISILLVGSLYIFSLRAWLLFSFSLIVTYAMVWYAMFHHFYYWLPLVTPVLLLVPSLMILVSVYHHRHSIKISETTANTLQQYLPSQVALQMRDNLEKLQHQRQTVECICMLTDLVGFTSLAEKMSAEELHVFMNRYYQQLNQIIHRHGGTIANIVGDGLLALWTGMELNEELKHNVCRAALEVVSTIDDPKLGGLPTCIGIHSGEISLGNLGAAGHFEYAPVGDTINTTARVEAYNRQLGTRILLTDAVGADIRLFRTQYHGKVLFKGKTKAVGVYELIDSAPLSDK